MPRPPPLEGPPPGGLRWLLPLRSAPRNGERPIGAAKSQTIRCRGLVPTPPSPGQTGMRAATRRGTAWTCRDRGDVNPHTPEVLAQARPPAETRVGGTVCMLLEAPQATMGGLDPNGPPYIILSFPDTHTHTHTQTTHTHTHRQTHTQPCSSPCWRCRYHMALAMVAASVRTAADLW